MNGKDIFLGMRYVESEFIEEAEFGKFPSRAEQTETVKKRKAFRRPFLIAALIALMLLLVGCGVVYVMKMQEIKLGNQTVTYDVYDVDPNSEDPFAVVGQETKTQQVLTLAGLSGTSQAAREWYDFLETYDPDGEIKKAVWGSEPDFGEEYDGYGLYTQEMKDKLDEILAKYDLKLRGKQVEFQTSKLLLRALGIENVLNPDSEAKMQIGNAAYYENGNLDLSFAITIPGEDGADPEKTNGYLRYRSKDCFIPDTAVLTEAEWEEWNYTTAAGDDVLILRSEEASNAWIFCDTANYTASLRLDIIREMYEEKVDGVPVAKFDMMTKAQLEQVADAIDFSLEPKLVDGWETMSDNAVPAGQEINGYKIEPVSAFTDGYGYQIVLRITAPEGVALTDPEDHTAQVETGNGSLGLCVEDGDGKRNTCHVILSDAVPKEERSEDGSFPYPEGNVIPVYWEDLYFTRYDFENYHTDATLLIEGTWKFNIPLSDADTREIELLTQPITAEGCYGWRLDGTDATAEYEVTSIKLRSLGIDVTYKNHGEGSPNFFCFNRQYSYVVMKDGTWMEFTSGSFDQIIDLDQVAYVQLADKTIVPMPGVDEETVNLISEMLQAEWDAAYVPAPTFEDGIELLTEPITMKSLGGYATDATGDMEPLYEYLTMTSIILHPDGLAIMGPAAFDSPEDQATVVLKDGSEIILTGMGGSPYCDEPMSQLATESTIDLTQVDYVILPDGTKLMVPQT